MPGELKSDSMINSPLLYCLVNNRHNFYGRMQLSPRYCSLWNRVLYCGCSAFVRRLE
jgi:hypothetical protein